MAATCDINLTIVAMETNKTQRCFPYLKVQMKLVICTKFHVKRMSCVESLRVIIVSSRFLGLM